MLAVGGFEEVISLFDVSKKVDRGQLMGSNSHQGSITALDFYRDDFLVSGAEDSDLIIWRCSDWQQLHRLSIKNKSKVESISMHNSGKMLLALYGNGVLRLWNMMDARCHFKRKLGVIEEEEPVSER